MALKRMLVMVGASLLACAADCEDDEDDDGVGDVGDDDVVDDDVRLFLLGRTPMVETSLATAESSNSLSDDDDESLE